MKTILLLALLSPIAMGQTPSPTPVVLTGTWDTIITGFHQYEISFIDNQLVITNTGGQEIDISPDGKITRKAVSEKDEWKIIYDIFHKLIYLRDDPL